MISCGAQNTKPLLVYHQSKAASSPLSFLSQNLSAESALTAFFLESEKKEKNEENNNTEKHQEK